MLITSYTEVFYIVLCCIVLFYIVPYYFVLYCLILYMLYISLYRTLHLAETDRNKLTSELQAEVTKHKECLQIQLTHERDLAVMTSRNEALQQQLLGKFTLLNCLFYMYVYICKYVYISDILYINLYTRYF